MIRAQNCLAGHKREAKYFFFLISKSNFDQFFFSCFLSIFSFPNPKFTICSKCQIVYCFLCVFSCFISTDQLFIHYYYIIFQRKSQQAVGERDPLPNLPLLKGEGLKLSKQKTTFTRWAFAASLLEALLMLKKERHAMSGVVCAYETSFVTLLANSPCW